MRFRLVPKSSTLSGQYALCCRKGASFRAHCTNLNGNAEFAGVDNAGVDNSAPCCRDGLCRSGQISTMWQGWTLQELTMRHHVAGVDNAGVECTVQSSKAVYKITSLANDSLYI